MMRKSKCDSVRNGHRIGPSSKFALFSTILLRLVVTLRLFVCFRLRLWFSVCVREWQSQAFLSSTAKLFRRRSPAWNGQLLMCFNTMEWRIVIVQFVISKTEKNSTAWNFVDVCSVPTMGCTVWSRCRCCCFLFHLPRNLHIWCVWKMETNECDGSRCATWYYICHEKFTSKWSDLHAMGMGTARAWDVSINWQNTKCNTNSLHPRTPNGCVTDGTGEPGPRWTPAEFWCRTLDDSAFEINT